MALKFDATFEGKHGQCDSIIFPKTFSFEGPK